MTQSEHMAAFVRVIATSDLHMHLLSHDYYADRPMPQVGLQALYQTIQELRQEAIDAGGTCLLVDNGDLLQGTPLADYIVDSHDLGTPHPLAELMGGLGYDAVGLGNHDLDYGLPYLASFARSLPVPVLSSNLHLETNEDWLQASVIVHSGPLRVGILSVLPERTNTWAYAQLNAQATVSDMRRAAQLTAQRLRAEGADLVLALAHTGIGKGDDENALDRIAQDGVVDALVGGHTHRLFPDPDDTDTTGADMARGLLFGVPTVMPGVAGAKLGCLDLHLTRHTDGKGWFLTRGQGWLMTGRDAPQPELFSPVISAHSATCALLETVMGHTDVPLTSYFAQLMPTPMLAICAAAKYVAIDNVRRDTPFADVPLLAAASPARAGGSGGPQNYADIAAGPLRRREIAQLHVFPNKVWAVPVNGAELRDWLERAAAAFHAPDMIASKGLISPQVPAFDFDVMFGVTYRIDPSAAPRFSASGAVRPAQSGRISDLCYKGNPVQDGDRFLVATSSHRACGGGQFPNLSPNRDMLRTDLGAAQVMQAYVQSGAVPMFEPPWSMAPNVSGLRTWIDTGPGALNHLDEIAHFDPGPPEMTPAGFLRIPITL